MNQRNLYEEDIDKTYISKNKFRLLLQNVFNRIINLETKLHRQAMHHKTESQKNNQQKVSVIYGPLR